MKIIKFGGSAITYKSDFESINEDALQRLCRELATVTGRYVLVHGAGSFGHYQAKQYGVAAGGTPDTIAYGIAGI